MNWVEINGIRSTFVEGLMINSLPPITMPAKRADFEQVNGRDGDVVHTYGYEAYDREFNISVLPNGNVNEVIEFFNKEGTIVFSNEFGKYYKFHMVSQINFERLIRYRTAVVTLHVQPFKYSCEPPCEKNITTETYIKVSNAGNVDARPKITLTASGTVTLTLNGNTVFTIALGTDTGITIDTEKMEAYAVGDPTTLKNRKVTGNYDSFRLPPGENTIGWTGTVSKITTENTSRWI